MLWLKYFAILAALISVLSGSYVAPLAPPAGLDEAMVRAYIRNQEDEDECYG
jgi:hypothetical protein